mmetsp:Transcript_18083/g.30373  ORF Transcript_18083/g.30373 Transcript_18083/m.30373 type:complete len:84 (+) Transcript_18083:664-915(+)
MAREAPSKALGKSYDKPHQRQKSSSLSLQGQRCCPAAFPKNATRMERPQLRTQHLRRIQSKDGRPILFLRLRKMGEAWGYMTI